jgi:hypothetical protein
MKKEVIRFGIYVESDTADALRTIAKQEKRTQAQQIAFVLEQYITEYLSRGK